MTKKNARTIEGVRNKWVEISFLMASSPHALGFVIKKTPPLFRNGVSMISKP
jgi:hypothetical protein